MREKQIKHQSDKKLRHNLRTVIDRGMDRTVMGARRSREGKPQAADHLLRAMEYLVEAKALSNEMMKRWGRARKNNRLLIKKIQSMPKPDFIDTSQYTSEMLMGIFDPTFGVEKDVE